MRTSTSLATIGAGLLLVVLSVMLLVNSSCSSVPAATVGDVCGTARTICATANSICDALGQGVLTNADQENLAALATRLDSARAVLHNQITIPAAVPFVLPRRAQPGIPADVRTLATRLDSLALLVSTAARYQAAYP